jgi:2-polyprenyl-3-methyl-5-hydroxy-6-metoxy-1,4-benzoquinol methylase
MKTWSTPVTNQDARTIPCALCGGLHFKPRLTCEGFSYVICTQCGLVQMNPQPKPTDVQHRYRDGHGEAYLSYETANEPAFLRLQELSLADAGFYALEKDLLPASAVTAAGYPAAPSVLDIGCATGALLAALAQRGWKTTGVEISTPQAEYARLKRNLDIKTRPLEENHFPDNSFTVVLASHLIEHLNDPASFIREVYRILEPGGHFFITTPNIAGFQSRLFRGRWRSAIFDHLYLFSKKTLSLLLTRSGFRIEKIITWGGLAAGIAPAPVKKLADKAAKQFGFGDVMMIRGRT